MSNVASVVRHFSTSNEGYSTTLSAQIASGATTVPLTSTAGLVDGTVFVGVVDPALLKQQVFTGTVQTATNSIINVVWTRGTNVIHTVGAVVVDYVTGTDHNMTTKGILVEHTQDGKHGMINATGVTVNGGLLMPTGGIIPYAVATAPAGWLICDGAAVSRTTYNALFAVLGSTYGAGDGLTTFGLPNLKGRAVFGRDTAQTEFDVMGEVGGQKDVMAHTHGPGTFQVFAVPGALGDTATNLDDIPGSNGPARGGSTQVGSMTGNSASTGTGANNLNPYMVLNYIIKT